MEAIERRLATWTKLDIVNQEDMQILRCALSCSSNPINSGIRVWADVIHVQGCAVWLALAGCLLRPRLAGSR